MQRKETIAQDNIHSILNAVYEAAVVVQEAYSKYDSDIVSFPTQDALEKYIESEISDGYRFINLVVHYPESKGFIQKKKINLKPDKCNGATLRYSMEGWGLIQLQMDYNNLLSVKCRFAVNTEKRANTWVETIPELKSPDLWDWKVVEKHARRLIRVLRKCA